MAAIDVKEILDLTPKLLNIPFKHIWYSYNEEADVLYLNFKNRAMPMTAFLPTMMLLSDMKMGR